MRKTLTYTATANGRDKVFVLTEMPAELAEKCAIRALFALGRAGIDLPEGIDEKTSQRLRGIVLVL